MNGYVYILKSLKNNRYYIGSAINLENRFMQHEQGKVLATKYLRPLKIVFSQCFESIVIARKLESKLKKYKSRQIVEKIIAEGKIKVCVD
jgi:putative endonuclease